LTSMDGVEGGLCTCVGAGSSLFSGSETSPKKFGEESSYSIVISSDTYIRYTVLWIRNYFLSDSDPDPIFVRVLDPYSDPL
jgi:hypothetical protein